MPDITILNGRKHKMKHEMSRIQTRRMRRNPDESLASQAGAAALATVIAAPAAIILDRAISGMKKKDGTVLYTENQSAMLLGAIGVVGGVALHIKGFSPKTGVALLAACGTLAGRRALAARQAAAATITPPVRPPADPLVIVIPPPAPPAADFTLVVAPVTASVTPLATGVVTQAYTITAARAVAATALADPVAISVTGLSAGVTSALSRLSLAAGETSTLTLTVPQASPPATVAFSIAGVNSTGTVRASATLVVGTAAAQGPYGYTRRALNSAGAAYGAQYGQVRSGEALAVEAFQGYSLSRPRIVPANATSSQIQGGCAPEQMIAQQPFGKAMLPVPTQSFGMATMPAQMRLPTAKNVADAKLDLVLAQIGAQAASEAVAMDNAAADAEQTMLMEQGMPISLITPGRNFGIPVMEGQDVMASKGAGGQRSEEEAQAYAAMLQTESGDFDQRHAFDLARRKRATMQERANAQECICAHSPSGARVMKRRSMQR